MEKKLNIEELFRDLVGTKKFFEAIKVNDIESAFKKQGLDIRSKEVKPVSDRPLPKFHIGDWIVKVDSIEKPILITNLNEQGYDTFYGTVIGYTHEYEYEHWSFEKHARPGDYLQYDNNWILIFREYDGCNLWYSALYSKEDNDITLYDGCYASDNRKISPATQEQKDLLESELVKHGYCFNKNKNEISFIRTIKEKEKTNNCNLDDVCEWLRKYAKNFVYLDFQNPIGDTKANYGTESLIMYLRDAMNKNQQRLKSTRNG